MKQKSASRQSDRMGAQRTAPDNILGKPRATKLPVQSPTSFGEFVVAFSMHVCRKILIVNTSWKFAIYLLGVMIGSLITDLIPFPSTYFSYKRNFLNVYFVKLGWGWTLSLLIPYLFLTSYVLCCGNFKEIMRKHMCRLVIATFHWYLCTSLFEYVEHLSGICSSGQEDKHTSKSLCLREGYTWIAFDISGHCFLLVHCLLTISEEVKSFDQWVRISEFISKEKNNPVSHLSSEQLKTLNVSYFRCTPYIRVLIVLLTLLQCLWEIMLLATTLYFHNMPQKVMGVLFSCLGWYSCYHLWYTSNSNIFPVLPGKSSIRRFLSKPK